jgi:methyl-accepting chemotaxis protein
MVSLIATATTEQRSAAAEISQGISDVARRTSDSAETSKIDVQECAELKTLAANMEATVKEFIIDSKDQKGGHAHSTPVVVRSSRPQTAY